ncbi:glycoside hydrolase family 97 protein [Singulisphaera acidiphila]|uniref:Glycoside hydrolase 97 n=1 Tax=Singulisphaera acidiphila (strain ATCC BAA-1392 / DSM 18658 / VKM B-2454 / MOB10) TaxID=886293 RepID=L0DK87_SINAD|nr:glycoside hydrolase family 97 protein [Singulisphaera acidiphila]AGA29066.1 Glycoside hydrolase 97 [Singulisphaera acidiphila DSM 18658]
MKTMRALTVALWLTAHGANAPEAFAAPSAVVEVESPNGKIRMRLKTGDDHLEYQVDLANRPVITTSQAGIVIDGVDLGQAAELGRAELFQADEVYPTRGVHSQATNRFRGARVPVRHGKSETDYTVEIRVFNDGVAFRYVVPGGDAKRVVDEATSFRLVPGSTVWYHNLRGHYEGIHARKAIAEAEAGDWAAPPLTIKLPEGHGYASITEGAVTGFSGMALQADGKLGFAARLGHTHPASYPFTLRYGDEEAKRLTKPAAIQGTTHSPWRIVMIGADLNSLANCDIVSNVSLPPDAKLFPAGLKTDWVRPGRAVWQYLDGGKKNLEGIKEFSRLAGELGFEYNIVEGLWQKWSDAELRDLVQYSKDRNVGIWLWKHSRDIRSPEARRAFFRKCQDAGVVGVKLDFFDHEAKEVVDLFEACLRDAAEHHLMVDFHGANKPTGESRTWPNEMTREGIAGLEGGKREAWATHNATWPFTRLLAGHADYTPMHFGARRRETSWTHQIASAAVLTSPVLVYAAHPKSMLENPAAEMIKSIPSVWDETLVLPISEIGERAAFARRSGDRWFLAIVNGPAAGTVRVPTSFLGAGTYQAMLVRDREDEPAAVKIEEATATKDDSIAIDLRAGGGFIARFVKP